MTLPHLSRDEASVVLSIIDMGLKVGMSLSVYDGEEWTLKNSRDRAAILDALGTTETDTIKFRHADGTTFGAIVLIYGNGPGDIIADYSANDEFQIFVEQFTT